MDFKMCFILFFITVPIVLSQSSESVVRTPQGSIHGKLQNFPGFGIVSVYQGIPYAKPPTGPLRFKPPQNLIYNSTTQYNATHSSPACPQDTTRLHQASNTQTSEDCLYLNVYVPGSNLTNLPVMVWIHGGSFTTGSGSMYDGRILSLRGQVIVVTINYRLGVLGFFPTGGTESTLGLQDQIMALQWVQNMISSFGGNPNEVTIFGESAGGASVSLLSVSPRARGLFKRVIPQSGVAISSWVIIPGNAETKMYQITNAVKAAGCHKHPVECLQYAPIDHLVQLTSMMIITQPEVDNDVIMADYATNAALVHPGLEFIMGTLPNEGAMSVFLSCSNMYTTKCDVYQGMNVDALKFTLILPRDIDNDQANNVIEQYNSWYPLDVQAGNMNMMAATKLGTDRGYKIPVNRTASWLDNAGFKVRAYVINSVADTGSPMPVVPWSRDAQHADEIPFLFFNMTEGIDAQVSTTLIKLWTDFAKGQLSESRWPLFHSHHAHYLHIDDQNPQGQIREPYFAEKKNAFWRNYFQYGVFPETVSSGRVAKPPLLSLLITGVLLFTILG